MSRINRSHEAEPFSESVEIEVLQRELGREREMHLRTLADFDNFRRRVERERLSMAKAGKREILQPLLEEMDSFDRALLHLEGAPTGLAAGIQAIHRNLLGLLESQGIVPFDSVGEAFDPERHEAMGTVSAPGTEPGIVVEEAQRGYQWGDEILRPARVRIAR